MTETEDDILLDLKWSEPVVRAGKALCTAEPTSDFWDYYRDYKDELKKRGISVSKYTGKWQVCWWRELEVFYTQEYRNDKPLKKLKAGIAKQLIPYQVPHTLQMVNAFKRYGAAIDGSKTGTGKTYTTAALAAELGYGLLVCCPKTVIRDWHVAAARFKTRVAGVYSWEKLKAGNTQWLQKVPKEKADGPDVADLKFRWELPDKTLLIFDEAHRAGNYGTQNTDMVIAARDSAIPHLYLSATIADNPMQMRAVGYGLKLFPNLSDFWGWAKGMGCAKTMNGWEFVGTSEQIVRIHGHLYPDRGSRMPESVLPATQIKAVAYTLDNAKKIEAVYREMEESLRALAEREALDGRGAEIDPDTGEVIDTEEAPNILTIQLRARQKVEILKVPLFADLIAEQRENGFSVTVFVNFLETLEQLKVRYPDFAIIRGGQTQQQRDDEIARFQANKTRGMIAQVRAGGTGTSLHDLDGKFPRYSLISPTFSAKDLIQVFGRVQRAGGSKSLQRVVFAADTIEETVCERVQEKIDRITLLNDGDLAVGIKLL